MTANDKMIQAVQKVGLELCFDNLQWVHDHETGCDEIDWDGVEIENPEEVIGAVIDAAWHLYDREDEATWPKTELAPSGVRWLVREPKYNVEAVMLPFSLKDGCFGTRSYGGCWPAAYADPADLFPSFVNCLSIGKQ